MKLKPFWGLTLFLTNNLYQQPEPEVMQKDSPGNGCQAGGIRDGASVCVCLVCACLHVEVCIRLGVFTRVHVCIRGCVFAGVCLACRPHFLVPEGAVRTLGPSVDLPRDLALSGSTVSGPGAHS